ncbi:PHA/PHB synthase family protein [Hyphomonas sp.]|uniref:PHA/PHB synthase family protein n=1 Tax=Hyphomonas sp. TaxID=87 RepID=UPI00391CE6C6
MTARKPDQRAQPACAAEDETEELLRDLDRRLRGRFARMTGGQSPWAALQAYEDWLFHLSVSPARQFELWWRWGEAANRLVAAAAHPAPEDWAFKPEPGDRRFRSPSWTRPPFHLLAQAHLAAEAQWRLATSCLRGVADHHARRVTFMGASVLNAMAPVNFPWSNPDVVDATLASGGRNFLQGLHNLLQDVAVAGGQRHGQADSPWQVGKTLATTPGDVIWRGELCELIRYRPQTPSVHAEPVLIVPAWIMKYYILDLTAEDSFARWLASQGYTVYILSWKNPGPDDRGISFDDYRRLGVMAAIDRVSEEAGGQRIHGVGYCLGGTVLAIAAAAMGRRKDNRLATLTLLAAQTDFREAGELLLFIDESQVALLEDMMHVEGTLDARNMSGAFSMLRAHEMVYSRIVERYLIGRAGVQGPLDAWLSDATRMPARMHGEYLRQLFLENRFTHGELAVDGEFVAAKDIRIPVFALGAERDHIAPWRSVYRIGLHGRSETTFVLTGGGHNTSVVSPPGKPGAYYHTGPVIGEADHLEPEGWLSNARRHEGSWWPEWLSWLKARASPVEVAPPPSPKEGLGPAPGLYVHEA